MTYKTGAFQSTDTINTVLQTIHDFAVSCGWTVNNYDDTAGSLAISNGTTFVNMNTNTTYTVDDTENSGNNAAPDYHLDYFLSDSYPVVGNDYTYQHGLFGDGVRCNDLVPPYSNYWLFSGAAGDPPYIYMVIQKASGRFCTLMFGQVDKKGVNYSGGDFAMTVYWNWWFANGSAIQNNGASGQGSDPFSGNNRFPGTDCDYNVRLGDACPAHPFTSHNAGQFGRAYQYGIEGMFYRGNHPTSVTQLGSGSNRWMGHFYWLGPHPINGNTPLFEYPIIFNDGYVSGRGIALGAVPGYRFCSMIGRTAAEEITYGNDNWIVFPAKANEPWNPEPFATKTITSGIYGHAFKVNP